MIEFRCPNCEKLLKVGDEKAGVRAKCPGCGDSLTIPMMDADIVEAEGFDDNDDEEYVQSQPTAPTPSRSEPNAEMTTCPMCAEVIRAAAKRCRFCGFSEDDPEDEPELWRDGKLLVMHKTAELPDRCIKSNQPANGYRLTRKLYWHPPAVYLALLVCLLLYVILALVLRKDAEIRIGLSEEWVRKRRLAITVGWILAVGSIAMIFCSGIAENVFGDAVGFIILLSIILFFVGAIYGIVGSRMIVPTCITDDMVWLKGVHPDFLAELPRWQGD